MTCVYKKDAITYCITSENSSKVMCCKLQYVHTIVVS